MTTGARSAGGHAVAARDAGATALLRLEGLNKSFGNLVVTRNVSLTVRKGERHALIGPNGAGKTSLVHQIAGQLAPTSGRILLNDRDLVGETPEARCQLGIGRTFQKNNLFRALSVRENVRLALQAKRGGWFQCLRPAAADAALRDEAEAVLAQVRLTSGHDRLVSSLSYGEQRQLEVALALASRPSVLLLDEPTSGMSVAETDGMIDLVRTLPADLGILMIEHDMKVVFELADTITVLYYGEVLASGPPAAIRDDAKVRDVYLGLGH
jgi:branched-chain amino acid transport system ATP-binding protein